MQQVRRILDMVSADRLSPADAAKLLEALSPRLNLSKGSWDHFFSLLAAGDFSPDELSALLEARTGPRRARSGFTDVLENLPGQISGFVQHINQAVAATRSSIPAGMLCIEVKGKTTSQVETDVRANLPLALADHMLKLLPQAALEALSGQGIDTAALREAIKPAMPPTQILDVKTSSGGRVRVWTE